ncbi:MULTISPECIES: type II toxin-antitoxin system RelE/ParE family toxin [Pseudomonas]|uniref:Type II toxin-antitoxin system RelE/ParE family toxin n=1 Tax=Pseudomonas azadiae TaxID=2843612 RepID=A0ABS6NXX3_9PSED|nr:MULTISPECIES: type II toxin-antitoxin system RelE/ParE family toxin [Pseudomonas]MBV4453053.1 type II toxin-antitoxin system RelE/ParE family toxin [Pseudomonas azadiae]NMF41626.1 type II toxin-antitoxin system RelE/ParE family toxin [Pseudomonas sp. SWRI 103]
MSTCENNGSLAGVGKDCRWGAELFADAARKAWICDSALSEAFGQLLKGQADSLGGGVWKKRLNQNRHRSIILAKGRHYWVYQFLFAKQDQSNISQKDLIWFRAMAKTYEGLNEAQVQQLLDLREFVEIHHDQKI